MKNKVFYFILLAITILISTNFNIGHAQASPAGDVTLYVGDAWDGTQKGLGFYAGTVKSWNDYYTAVTCDRLSGGGNVGWYNSNSGGTLHVEPSDITVMRWDTGTTIPAGSVVKNAYVLLSVSTKTDTSPLYSDFYFSLYRTNPGADNVITVNDNNKTCYAPAQQRQTAPHHYNTLVPGGTENMTLGDPNYVLDRWNGTNYIWLALITEHQGLMYSPSVEASGTQIYAAINHAKLYVTYTPPATPRNESLHTNIPFTGMALGTEVANNITLETLSCMYADEYLSFLVNGDPGANVTTEMLDKNGTIINSINGQLGDDGIYAYQYKFANSYSGFVRCHETKFNLMSTWVSVQPSPDSTELNNCTYAYSTQYPQYTVPFSSYVTNVGNLMYVHWKTNIATTELGDFTFKLYSNGDNTSAIYESVFTDMASNYFLGITANQENLIPWRYAIYTISEPSGFQDYGGLVLNLNLQNPGYYHGYIEPMIIRNSDGTELVTPVSAYWYLTDATHGIGLNMSANTYKKKDAVTLILNVGDECKVQTDLSFVRIEFVGSTSYYYNCIAGENDYTPGAFNDAGNYIARVHLYDVSRTSYQYIYDLPFVVSSDTSPSTPGGTPGEEPTAGGWWNWFKSMMGKYGLDNPGGHWLLIFILSIILAIAFRKTPAVATVLVLLVFAGGFVFSWIDQWFIALLAIAAGLTIYSFFRRKEKGSKSDES